MSNWKDRHFAQFHPIPTPENKMPDEPETYLPNPKTNPARYKDPEELGDKEKRAPLQEKDLPPGPKGPITDPVTSPQVEGGAPKPPAQPGQPVP